MNFEKIPQFNLIGSEKSPEEYKKIRETLKDWQKEGLEKIEGEYEKSEEEIKFINKINSYFDKELEEIGVERRVDSKPERVHFLSDEVFKKEFPEAGEARGVQRSHEDIICLNKDIFAGNRLGLYKTIGHELLHNLSFQKYFVDTERKKIRGYRGGYRVQAAREDNHEHFRGLNEAITDKFLKEVFLKNKDEIISEFNISKEEQQKPVPYQHENIAILDAIIEKIVKEKNENQKDVWGKFKRGMFTGEMMHLRDVDRVFGRGSLRVLAALDSEGSTKNLSPEKIDSDILKYFTTDNQKEKRKIALSILSERERGCFLKENQKTAG
jgi:hypothetical protein